MAASTSPESAPRPTATPARKAVSGAAGRATLCAVSGSGRLLLFPLADIKEMSKGRGLMVMDLDKSDEMVGVTVNYGNFVTLEGAGRGGKTSSVTIEGAELDSHRGKRANKGQLIAAKLKPTGIS